MSELIFEGNTTKRFGDRFARPFIEEVRTYDNGVEIDIAFYFQVPSTDEEVETFKDILKSPSQFSQNIVTSVCPERVLKLIQGGGSFASLMPLLTESRDLRGSISTRAAMGATVGPAAAASAGPGFGGAASTGPSPASAGPGFGGAAAGPGFGGAASTGPGPGGAAFGATTATTGPITKFDNISFEDFLQDSNTNMKDDYYNLQGQRFLKIYGTRYLPIIENEIVYATCFVKNGSGLQLFDGQTSDLIFEKILNKDGSTNADMVQAYQEPDGNFYYQPPLMGFDSRYHKTDEYAHKDLINQINDVIANYNIDEAGTIAYILSEHSVDPQILLKLKSTLDGFTSKTSATEIGKLYAAVAQSLVLADRLIRNQEVVTKKSFANTKVKDYREASLPTLERVENNSLRYSSPLPAASDFLPPPLISKSMFAFSPGNMSRTVKETLFLDSPPEDFASYFRLETNAYHFFDYEKALNYQSEISNFINPYNIEQIFGKGSLANFFQFNVVKLEKVKNQDLGPLRSVKTYYLKYSDGVPNELIISNEDPSENIDILVGSPGVAGLAVYAATGDEEFSNENAILFRGSDGETIYSQFTQRGFDTTMGLNGYRLACFELNDYETFSSFNNNVFTCKVTIEDRTMEFYDTYIRQRISSVRDALQEYVSMAEEFCSYNNIDGKFNEFFAKSIKEKFEQPYPWDEAALYYLLFLQMINSSWNNTGGPLTRRREGALLDLDAIREAAIIMNKNINPDTGTLPSLLDFAQKMNNLVTGYFEANSGLDKSNQIYRDDGAYSGTYTLKQPELTLIFEREDIIYQDDLIDEFDTFEREAARQVMENMEARNEAAAAAETEDNTTQCRLYQSNFAEQYEEALDRAGTSSYTNIFSTDAKNLLRIADNYNNDQCGDLLGERVHPDIEAIRNYWENIV